MIFVYVHWFWVKCNTKEVMWDAKQINRLKFSMVKFLQVQFSIPRITGKTGKNFHHGQSLLIEDILCYKCAQFMTQLILKQPACFETGWPDSWPLKGNGMLWNRLGGRLWNQLVDTNVVVTGQFICWFWNSLGGHQHGTDLLQNWPMYAPIVWTVG